MEKYKPYLDFVRYSVNSNSKLPDSSKDIDWVDFYAFCIRQGIVGVVFGGLENSGIKLPQKEFFDWIGTAEAIKVSNQIINERCGQISRFWEGMGYRSCILKGQANAMMYPKPELRCPGDIDIWVDFHKDVRYEEDLAAEIIRIALRESPEGHFSLHHVTMPVYKDTLVEVHYRPIFLENWWKDKKLQQYIDKIKNAQFENEVTLLNDKTKICRLTDEFNALFLLLHMWHHLLSTRNNLKQLIDYYYLLTRSFSTNQKEKIGKLFQEFGVCKYASGIMWIEQQVLGLPRECLIVGPDEKVGHILLKEILHYGENRKKQGKFGILLSRVMRNLNLFRYFPLPVLIAPVYLVWHQWWKINMKLKL